MRDLARYTGLLCVALAGLSMCGAAWSSGMAQASVLQTKTAADVFAPSMPSTAERQKLLSESFVEVRDAAALPVSCKSGFATLAKTRGFELANPGQPYQATDVLSPGRRLPWRRMLLAGVSSDRCVVFYEVGGFAPYRTVVVLDVSQNGPATKVWGGSGGKHPEDLHALISQIAAGAFTQPIGF